MGTVIEFPEARRVVRLAPADARPVGSASIVILPTIRVERHAGEPPGGTSGNSAGAAGDTRRPRAR